MKKIKIDIFSISKLKKIILFFLKFPILENINTSDLKKLKHTNNVVCKELRLMKKHHILHFLITLAVLLYPSTIFAYSNKIIPGGENIGIELNSKGVLVVGFYKVNNEYIGSNSGLQLGDRITKINSTEVNTINQMVEAINKEVQNNKVVLTFLRDNEEKQTELTLVKDQNDVYKTGLFVKDQITGVGTLTYIDPGTQIYGALGHEIVDKNTLTKIEIKDGKIFKSEVVGIDKSERGSPGEKTAQFFKDEIYGNIKENESSGIFGTYGSKFDENDAIEVGDPDDVQVKEATIRTVIHDHTVEEFKINILKVDKENETKNILFEITDERLLKETGGIIQGMSGSPIIQDGKLIGAVTHVIVNDAKKGYGIFITTMLEEGEN